MHLMPSSPQAEAQQRALIVAMLCASLGQARTSSSRRLKKHKSTQSAPRHVFGQGADQLQQSASGQLPEWPRPLTKFEDSGSDSGESS